MSEFPAGLSVERLPELDREFLEFVDDHLPDFDSPEAIERYSTYDIEGSDNYPVPLRQIYFGSSLGSDNEGLAAETRVVEFMVDGPDNILMSVLGIYWTPREGFNISLATGESGLKDPEFIRRNLNKLQELDLDGKLTPVSKSDEPPMVD